MSPSTERKLTTILSADAVGYSRLMGQDETGTFATLKAYRELTAARIATHRGRVVNTAGDSILAEFPSVVKAVECAVDIQRTIAERNSALAQDRQMWFRIGINLGDVMVDNDDLFGDGVNVAARLQGLADPGGILISGTVFDHVKDKLAVSFDALGAQSIKNIPAQVPVYRVVLEPRREGTEAAAALLLREPTDQPGDARQAQRPERWHRFLMNTAFAGTAIAVLFGINILAGGEFWFQWPALAILFVHALRSIFLFLKPAAPLVPEPVDSSSDARQAGRAERLHRFYMYTAVAGTLIAFLLAINLFTGEPFWFKWPTLVIVLIHALRTIFLFRKPI